MKLLCDLVFGQRPAAPHRLAPTVVVGRPNRLPAKPVEAVDAVEATNRSVVGIMAEGEKKVRLGEADDSKWSVAVAEDFAGHMAP